MKRFIKILLGLLLLPLAFSVLLSVFEICWYLVKGYSITLYFIAGAVIYVLMHLLVYDFSRMYVIAHEFSHAFAALLCGYKVSGFKLGSDSGSVRVSDINTFVLLAPYFIPLYSILLTAVYIIGKLFWPQLQNYACWFLGLFGFFTAMHFTHTYKALTETEQSDIDKAGGGIFSFPVIILANTALVLLLAEFYFPGVLPAADICSGILGRTWQFWKWVYIKIFGLLKILYFYFTNK